MFAEVTLLLVVGTGCECWAPMMVRPDLVRPELEKLRSSILVKFFCPESKSLFSAEK